MEGFAGLVPTALDEVVVTESRLGWAQKPCVPEGWELEGTRVYLRL